MHPIPFWTVTLGNVLTTLVLSVLVLWGWGAVLYRLIRLERRVDTLVEATVNGGTAPKLHAVRS